MSGTQSGVVYRYFPVDADHDVSSDVMEASLDDVAWTGLSYVQPVDYPPSVAAANAARPAPAGYVRYWWRALTGPAQTLPLPTGYVTVYGRLTDNPETPHFEWTFTVAPSE